MLLATARATDLAKSVSQTVIKALLLNSGCVFGRLNTFRTLNEGKITAFQRFLRSGVDNSLRKLYMSCSRSIKTMSSVFVRRSKSFNVVPGTVIIVGKSTPSYTLYNLRYVMIAYIPCVGISKVRFQIVSVF